MTNIFNFESPADFLKSVLETRKFKNPKYSLRAFARDLDISFSRLSEYLHKDECMNAVTADKISMRLQLSAGEKEYLLLLVSAKNGRTVECREAAAKKIKDIHEKRQLVVIRKGFSGLLTKWFYIPLIELITLCDGRPLTRIADDLGVTLDEVSTAIAQLETAGHIVRIDDKTWKKSVPLLHIESANPQASIRDYHKNIIEAGARALKQPISKRKFISTVLGIRKGSVEDARREIEAFNRNFVAKYASEDAAETVYGINVQFFEYENLR